MKAKSVLASVLFIFGLAACEMDSDNTEKAYLGNLFNISSEQVYTRNRSATKISQVYKKYEEKKRYDIIVCTLINPEKTPEGKFQNQIIPSGSGDINNGILNFNVSNMEETELMDWEYFTEIFRQWDIVESSIEIKGTILMLEAFDGTTPIGALDRQRITGTDSKITQETLMYVYVNNDCTITGNKSEGYEPGNFHYYTEGDLNLKLKKGWNAVRRTETYGKKFSGSAHIDMKIINPIKNPGDYRWVIEPGFSL